MRVDLIFQLAGLGILASVVHTVLKQGGKEELGVIASWAVIALALGVILQLLAELFNEVRSVFGF